MYEDLLALPSAESVPSDNASIRPSEDDDDVTIQAIADRLLQQAVTSNDKAPLLLTDQLRKLRNVGNSTPGILEQPISDHVGSPITHASPLTNAIVSRLDTILSELENVQTYVAQNPSISVGLLTDQEWSTMIRVCVRV